MINFNGELVSPNAFATSNRAFLYADALFDTLLYKNESLIFIEDHYFRLLAGMRQLRMEIPGFFTQEFWENEIFKTIKDSHLKTARIRTTIFRNSLGYYFPESNEIQFVIQVNSVESKIKNPYTIGIYKDNLLNTNNIDNIKTTNKLIHVLASIYANENNFDNCLLMNHKKQIVSAINANIFLVSKTNIYSPALSEGCVNGITRKKMIELIRKSDDFQLIESAISAYDLPNADEIFLTNSIIGIQSVSNYKKTSYSNEVAAIFRVELEKGY